MKPSEIAEAMERYLPCPPAQEPEPGSDADYLWRATLANVKFQPRPRPVIELIEFTPYKEPWEVSVNDCVRIIRVECDALGRGVKVIRP